MRGLIIFVGVIVIVGALAHLGGWVDLSIYLSIFS